MKILHTADWHIGQFKGPIVDGVNLRSQDTVKCLEYQEYNILGKGKMSYPWCMREIDLLGATHWHLLMAKGGSYAKTGGLVDRR